MPRAVMPAFRDRLRDFLWGLVIWACLYVRCDRLASKRMPPFPHPFKTRNVPYFLGLVFVHMLCLLVDRIYMPPF